MSDEWSDRALLFVILACLGVQIAQALLVRATLTPYLQSYWIITYQFGFTRRGLGGELVRLAAGGAPSGPVVELVQGLITISTLGLIVALVLQLARQGNQRMKFAALMVVTSPFVIDFVASQRRPDQVGFAIVILYALVSLRFPSRSVLIALVAGILLGLAVLIQDSVLLECAPWMLVVLAISSRPRNLRRGVFAVEATSLCGPAVLAGALSVLLGRPGQSAVEGMAREAAGNFRWIDHQDAVPSVLGFLLDTFGESVDRVISLPVRVFVGSLLVGLSLVLLEVLIATLIFRGRFEIPHGIVVSVRRNRRLFLAWLTTVISLLAIMLVGIDVTRWITAYGLMATVAFASWLLVNPPDDTPLERSPLAALILMVAMTYTLLLWPLGDSYVPWVGIRNLLLVPGYQ